MDADKGIVLVTGATGFLAGWIIKDLLESGYKVRGSVRSVAQEDKVKHLKQLNNATQNLEFVEADLTKPETWKAAVKGCQYVCHTASPFQLKTPKDEQEFIKPAVEGTLAVLKAVADEKSVKRVVLTSSEAAITRGHTKDIYSDDDWSKIEDLQAYPKSKTLAEKAAWDFVSSLGENAFELTVVNPSYIIGPLMTDCAGEGSRTLITRMMKNDMPGIPDVWLNVVDVRDTAKIHVLAMTNPNVKGKRIISSAKGVWMKDVAQILSKEFTPKGYKLPSWEVPNALIWLISWWDQDAAFISKVLGVKYPLDASRAKNDLGVEFRPVEESLVAMANDLIRLGLVPDLSKNRT